MVSLLITFLLYLLWFITCMLTTVFGDCATEISPLLMGK